MSPPPRRTGRGRPGSLLFDDGVFEDGTPRGPIAGTAIEEAGGLAAFAGDCLRVVGDGGVLAMNVSDAPGLPTARATASAWGEGGWRGPVAMVTTREVARGKQPGNVVLVARRGDGPTDIAWVETLRRWATTAALPTEVLIAR